MYRNFLLHFVLIEFMIFKIALTQEDYQWKYFDGELPECAFVAGVDRRGEIYIGQVIIGGKIIPGRLYRNDKYLYFEYGGISRKAEKNVKVLCTRHPERLEWVTTRRDDHGRMGDLFLVTGGYEPGYNIYVGRVFDHGEAKIGRIVCKKNTYCVSSFPAINGLATEYLVYDILTYNSNLVNNINY